MSLETSKWLNTMTLIGFSEKRGKAWHYRAEDQGDEANHYVGAIPVEDVIRRLFYWKPQEAFIKAEVINEEGVFVFSDPTRKAIMRPAGTLSQDDQGGILGIFRGQPGTDEGYKIHDYEEWLVNQVSLILDDELGIGSAGLLREGGQAWVQVEVPENITTPSGVVFRPNLLAATSLDGSLSTTYKRTVTNVVCDNTMAAALQWEKGQQIKIRHSRYSNAKLQDVREALEIVHTIADDFQEQVEQLTNIAVNEGDWAAFLDSLVPLVDDKGNAKEGKGLTMATNKRAKINDLYYNSEMVAPWNGTAWGVVQAVNTFAHHVQGSKKGAERGQQNMLRAVHGEFDKLDRSTLSTLQSVLTPA